MNYEYLYDSPRLVLALINSDEAINVTINVRLSNFMEKELDIINSSLNSLTGFDEVSVLFSPQTDRVSIQMNSDFGYVGVVLNGSPEEHKKMTGIQIVNLIRDEINKYDKSFRK